MSFKEKLKRIAATRNKEEGLKQKQTEGERLEEKRRKAEKEKEIERLRSIADEKLRPFLEMVNSIYLENEGRIRLSKELFGPMGPFTSYSLHWDLELSWGEWKKEAAYVPSFQSHYGGNRLILTLEKDLTVKIYAGGEITVHRAQDKAERVNLQDHNWEEQLGDYICSKLDSKKCAWGDYPSLDRY